MLDTLERQATASPNPLRVERLDDGWRSGYDAVPVMSIADDRPSTWIGRLAKGAFGFAPLTFFGRSRAHADVGQTIASSRSAGHGYSSYAQQHGYNSPSPYAYNSPSPYAPAEDHRRRRGGAYWAALVALLLFLGVLVPPLGRALGEDRPKPAVVGRNGIPVVQTTTVSPGTETTISSATTTPPTTTSPATTTPTTSPPTTVPPTTSPPTTPTTVVDPTRPFAQVLLAALAGLDLRVAVGVGDNACVGLQVGPIVVGCTPSARTTLGATAEVQASQLPPIHLSVP